MYRKLLSALLLAATLPACSFHGEIPSTTAHFKGLEARAIALPAFDRIVFDANALITLRMGHPQTLVLSTEPDHFAHLRASVTDGELLIEHTDRHSGNRYVKIDVVTPDLAAVQLDAVVEADFQDIEVDDIRIGFSGIGDVTFGGSCRRVTYNISAIGDFDAAQFLCHEVIARISGIGDATIYADGSLSLDVSGIGDVTVLGHPRVDRLRSRGMGDVSIQGRN